MMTMNCNYFKDNTKEIESRKKDTDFMLLIGIEGIPKTNCCTGIGDYEPLKEEQEIYCFADFRNCPRFLTRINK